MRRLFAAAVVMLAPPAPAAAAATLHTSPSGSSTSACTVIAPCSSFDRAYQLAAAGDNVQMGGGTYGPQTLNHDNDKNGATQRVVFAPALGTTVTVAGNLRGNTYGAENAQPGTSAAGAEHVEFRDLKVTGDTSLRYADDWVFDRVNFDGPYFVRSSSNITFRETDHGPWNDYTAEITANSSSSTRPSRTVLFDRASFHDVVLATPGAHTDCMSTGDVDGLTIRRSTFRNCQHFDLILATDYNGKSSRNVLIENNFFGRVRTPGGDLAIGETDGPVTIRHNSVVGPIVYTGGTVATSTLVLDSNVTAANQTVCTFGGTPTWTHNVFGSGAGCGTSRVIGSPGFVNQAGGDLHLTSGSAARNVGNPATGVTVDIDGDSRDATPDAGADEFAGATPTPTPTPTATPIPTPTPTATATATPTTTPTPTATPTPYAPACEPTCDQQIADLKDQIDRIRAITGE